MRTNRMKILLIFGAMSLTAATLSTAQQPAQNLQQERALSEARQVSSELAEKVRGFLLQEIEKGGWVSAVRVCSEKAQEMTRGFNAQPGQTVRRVSLRVRNPQNKPDEYERRRLEELDLLTQRKELRNEYFEVVKEGGQRYLRYMRPLTALPLCINCHGPKENISADVKAILADKYPDDRATGFLVGDLRGAISVKIILSPSK